MTTETYKSKAISFLELIQSHKLDIPIIQRDYAQGRKDKKEIRVNFLKALQDSIENNKPVKLDFIYGSSVNGSFQPLDGQQRLTTLFLLHWYAATKDNTLTEQKKTLEKFSYETRITSRDFCQALVNNKVEISEDLDTVSQLIIDSNWFFLSWKNDPTIDSMLRTIDDIHLLFKNIQNLWASLSSVTNIISFYNVELENIGLTDDLYIKMNARGKLLTPFENFKASFQKHIEDEKWEVGKNMQDHFAFKIDTVWTDYFWQHFKKNNTIDEAFMRFISAITMNKQSVDRTIVKSEDRLLFLSNLQEQPNSVKPVQVNKSTFDYLYNCFEIYGQVLDSGRNLDLQFPLWRHKPRKSLLSEIVFEDNAFSTVQTNTATYTQKILFFAQTEYLKRNNTFNEVSFKDWMRVVRNIISRGDIDKEGNRPDIVRSPQGFDSAINLINELADFSSNIYFNLATIDGLKSQFAKEQIEEERIKAKLITANQNYKEHIFELEDNELLRGRIDFVFYCMDYSKNPGEFDLEYFIKIKNIFKQYFNSEESLINDLRRALLTISVNNQFEFYKYWWSYWHVASAAKRRLFDKFREIEYYIYSDQREYFKKLVAELLSKSLKQITNDFSPPIGFPNWQLRLIKEDNLLDNSPSNYIAIADDNSCCWLLKSKRPRDMEGSLRIE